MRAYPNYYDSLLRIDKPNLYEEQIKKDADRSFAFEKQEGLKTKETVYRVLLAYSKYIII